MDSEERTRVGFTYDETSMPKTVFANHVEVVGVDGYTTVTFYSLVFPKAADIRADPPRLTARPVAQVTLPGEKWAELISRINQVDEEAMKRTQAGGEDGTGL